MLLLLAFVGIFENYEINSELSEDKNKNMYVHVFASFNNKFLPFCESNITDSFLTVQFLTKTMKKLVRN